MSPTHSQRVNIMSEVLWFRTLRMYFIPLFPTTKAWEVYQENTCAFSFSSITSVIDHWQGFGAGPLFWVRSPAHRGNWAAWLHTRSSLDCCQSRRLALRDKKCSLAHWNLPPWISDSDSTALPGAAMDWEQLSKLSWLWFAIQVTQLVLYISGQSKPMHSKSRSAPAFHNSRIRGCFPVSLGPDVGSLLHLFSFHTDIACSFFRAQSASYLHAKHLEEVSYCHPGILKVKTPLLDASEPQRAGDW